MICCDRKRNPMWFPYGPYQNGKMILNDAGRMVETGWLKMPERFKNIELRESVVMPNYFHAILEIAVWATLELLKKIWLLKKIRLPKKIWLPKKIGLHPKGVNRKEKGQHQGIAPTVGDILGAFKTIAAAEYIRGVKNPGWESFNRKLWQRNYW